MSATPRRIHLAEWVGAPYLWRLLASDHHWPPSRQDGGAEAAYVSESHAAGRFRNVVKFAANLRARDRKPWEMASPSATRVRRA
jgi:hypothetical protein